MKRGKRLQSRREKRSFSYNIFRNAHFLGMHTCTVCELLRKNCFRLIDNMPSFSQEMTAPSSSNARLKTLSLVVLIVQTTALVLVLRYSRTQVRIIIIRHSGSTPYISVLTPFFVDKMVEFLVGSNNVLIVFVFRRFLVRSTSHPLQFSFPKQSKLSLVSSSYSRNAVSPILH